LNEGKAAGRGDTHVATVKPETSGAKRPHDGVGFEPFGFDFDVDGFADLTDFVQIDAAVCGRLSIQHAYTPQQLKRTRSGGARTVIAAVPNFDSIELAANGTDHVDTSERRMRQHRNSTFVVYAIDQALHICEAYPPRDSISENMDFASVERELQAGDYDERFSGERLANPDVILHSAVVEYLGMITHGREAHPSMAQSHNDPVERLFSI